MARRAPDFVVGDPAEPYLRRWWLIPRNKIFNVYLHAFDRNDEDRALHDHPWSSVSLALSPAKPLREIYQIDNEIHRRVVRFGDVVVRGSRFAHRMIVPHPGTLTLFVTGPVVREWGFLCPRGWVHWRDFTAAGAKGQIGRGCGEHD